MRAPAGKAVVLTLLLLMIVPVHGSISSAVERSDKPLVVSRDQPDSEQTFPRMVAPYPRQNPAQAGAPGRTRSTERCRNAGILWCDAIPVKINVPPDTLYRLLIILTWPGTDAKDADGKLITDSQGRTQKPENDLDLYLRDLRTTKIIRKDGTTSTTTEDLELYVAASIWHPEFGSFGDLPPNNVEVETPVQAPTESKRTEVHDYWVTPVNFDGQNQGYTLKAVLRFPDDGLGSYEDPEEGFKFDFAETPPASSTSLGARSEAVPKPTLESVKVPGPDGPIEERQLAAIKAQEAQQQARGLSPLVIGVVVLVLGGVGLGTFFFIRSRRGESEVT